PPALGSPTTSMKSGPRFADAARLGPSIAPLVVVRELHNHGKGEKQWKPKERCRTPPSALRLLWESLSQKAKHSTVRFASTSGRVPQTRVGLLGSEPRP